ncbi:apoptosis regulatory protein Siva-like [Saccoglossus kowalevskii]|uniref:Apoptosis regulatory protein Siva-like isoform X1 n=1 Tax=Saccoglossus kowalevskii TaxID=10224 RepID=A0ABM0GZP0_SACKO|nr:PREDICTED: apoptosis regulatory protein Siva-like isoform X1 [Saccoglossus kowalevskii]
MPKRPRSEEYSSPLQLKTHVGDKQMNESKEENMKAVYDKTRTLLYSANASKTSNGVPKVNGDCNGSNIVPILPSGQTVINCEGKIVPATQAKPSDIPGNGCRHCNRQQCSLSPCHYCEKTICNRCQRYCDNCMQAYCLFCTIINYDDQYEKRLCVNCA